MVAAVYCTVWSEDATERAAVEFRNLLTAKRWVWKAAIAGLCGNITHTLLMLGKAKLGILEAFQPYQSLQIALSYSTGENIHPLMPIRVRAKHPKRRLSPSIAGGPRPRR